MSILHLRGAIKRFRRGRLTIYVHTNVRPWLVYVQWRRHQWWLFDFGQGLAVNPQEDE